MFKSTFAIYCLCLASLLAQKTPEATPPVARVVVEQPVAPPAPEVPAIPDDGIRVAALGYHDFSESLPETAMRIRTTKFRTQMAAIRQLGLPVISMNDFLAWRRGEKKIPAKSIVITLDDGWKSVYTEAYPVMKEYGYPFTLYLYQNYVDGGGKALTTPMIQEMLKHGAQIGNHSKSHPYPITVKSFRKKGVAEYDAYLRLEMADSKTFLESKFPIKAESYCYPGGFYTEEMLKLGKELGYQAMFTVIPGKIKRSSPEATLPRYIIEGKYDKIFELATTFREAAAPGNAANPAAGAISGVAQTTAYPVTPAPGAVINSRLPEISADLSKLPNLDPKSLIMKVSGFGEVPANFAAASGKFSWQVNRRLRQPGCQVVVTWKDLAGKPAEIPLRWSFQIDREPAYLPDGD
jgi:peptidoglycan/xylan/chitin deacetylase (PgdA/CDA1 family)